MKTYIVKSETMIYDDENSTIEGTFKNLEDAMKEVSNVGKKILKEFEDADYDEFDIEESKYYDKDNNRVDEILDQMREIIIGDEFSYLHSIIQIQEMELK